MNGFKFAFVFVAALFSRLFKKRPFSDWSLKLDVMVTAMRRFTASVSHWPVRPQRQLWDQLIPNNSALFRQVDVKANRIANAPSLCIQPKAQAHSKTALLYFHGGSFMFGSIKTHKAFCARLALNCNAEVNLVEYRLAPEYQFPYQINQLVDVFREFALQKKKAGHRIYLAGDGAGGNLVLALLLKLSAKEISEISGLILLSPWGDLSQLDGTLISNAKYDWLSPKLLQHWIYQYLEHSDVKDPLASPFLARFPSLPRTFLSVGSAEMLFSQVDHFFARNVRFQLPIQYAIANNMVHGWPLLEPYSEASQKLFQQIRSFVAAKPAVNTPQKSREEHELAF